MARKPKRIRNRKAHEALFLDTFAEILRNIELDGMDAADKLDLFFSPNHRKFCKRRILAPLSVTGLWWTKDAEEVLMKVHKTRKVMHAVTKYGTFYMYVREDDRDDYVDIEAKCYTAETSEFLTCSVSREEYKRISEFLGPELKVCSRHKKS